MAAEIDWTTVPLAVDDRTPPRLIATELLDEADAQPSLMPFLSERIAEAFGDPFKMLDEEVD